MTPRLVNSKSMIFLASSFVGGSRKGGFQRVVLADVPRYQKPERGYIRMFAGTKKRNEGALGCSQYQKPERGHIRRSRPFMKPPFYFFSNFGYYGTMRTREDTSRIPGDLSVTSRHLTAIRTQKNEKLNLLIFLVTWPQLGPFFVPACPL